MSNKLEPQFTNKYEKFVITSYSEFGKEKNNLKNWGMAEYDGKVIEFYNNPEFIREYFSEPILKHLEEKNCDYSAKLNLVDFGGGDGILIKTLIDQLKKDGYTNINGLNIDYTLKNLEKMRANNEKNLDQSDLKNIAVAQGDILKELPLKDNSVDIGVSRHVLQYFGKEAQPEVLKNLYNSLKSDGILVMKWPGADNPGQSSILTDFYAQTLGVCTNESSEEVAKNKYFVSYQEVEEIAKKIGYKIVAGGKCRAKLRITGEGFSDRFKLSPQQTEKMTKIFQEFYDRYKDQSQQFDMRKDQTGLIYSVQHHNYLTLEK